MLVSNYFVAAECAFAHLAPKNSVQRKIISTSLQTKGLSDFVYFLNSLRPIIVFSLKKLLGVDGFALFVNKEILLGVDF